MKLGNASKSLEKQKTMSFFTFLAENYELSRFVLPKQKPLNDNLEVQERDKLIELMNEKDFYEINTIIKKRYGK